MNYIDRPAIALAKMIHKNYPEGSSEAVLKYSLILLINSVLAITISLAICLYTGHFLQGCIVILFHTVLRYFSGGIHLPNSVSCNIYTIICFVTFAHIDFKYYSFGLIANIIALIIVAIYAPSGIERVSRIDSKYYPLLKWLSILIVATGILFESSMIAICSLVQALSMTKFAYRFINLLERGGKGI